MMRNHETSRKQQAVTLSGIIITGEMYNPNAGGMVIDSTNKAVTAWVMRAPAGRTDSPTLSG